MIAAHDGAEAVRKFEERSANIDLVMMDLTMPIKDGIDACTEIRGFRSDVPVVLMSGYGTDVDSERFESARVSEFLQKPFRLNTLQGVLGRYFA